MRESESLVNIGELSKPATTLIEKISDAVGGIFKPQQIRRVARAEVDAEIIRAQAAIEISDLQRRALQRFVAEETKKQANIESITEQALPQLYDQSSPEEMDNDWITSFFDRSRLISDGQMQILWSRLLAGEANQPGKFSKRTIDVLASLDKFDAELFSELCSFAVELGDKTPLIYDTEAPIYNNEGINFGTLIHLENIGLIHHGSLGYLRKGLRESGHIPYFGKKLYIRFPNPSKPMDIGKVMFSQIGKQLAYVVSVSSVDGFDTYLQEKWKELGYETEHGSSTTDTP